MFLFRWAAFIAAVCLSAPARADVVINEILYHAPDDLDKLQFIELHNTGNAAVELAGWKLGPSARYEFPAGMRIEANGFVVLCRDAELFRKHYGFDAAGTFSGALGHNGDQVELRDATSKRVDRVRFKTRDPWPVAADGSSSSLERICPTAPGDRPDNWAASPLPRSSPKPGGTPGKANANYSERIQPSISNVTVSPLHATPGQEIVVEADVKSATPLRTVEVLWRTAASNSESTEKTIPMARMKGDRYRAVIPGQETDRIVRCRIRAVDNPGATRIQPNENDLAPAYSVFVHEPFRPVRNPLGIVIHVSPPKMAPPRSYGPPSPDPPPRGNSAIVFVDAKTGRPELFDFVNITPRNGGEKVRFHKDHTLDGMNSINLIHEGSDRFILAEALAYDVYRKAGNAACRTDFVRMEIDGKPIGFQLLIEQPGKAFLRHNGLRTDGNFYKCQWFGRGLVGQHEKKTNVQEGHDDLVKLVAELNRTTGDEQWQVIRNNFDVEQVINYFAVNMVLSHWDGYFNNYFAYHDVGGTGKWTMYPWDQDKTWGFHDGIRGNEVFFDMPITFGMKGDKPPGTRGLAGFFGGGPIWWRPGGYFSQPLLANPHFRKLFLARTREILETVYTPEVMNPLIDAARQRLEIEVKHRAELQNEDPKAAADELQQQVKSLREHLTKRREFLLKQDEIKSAGKFDRTELK